VKVENHNDGCCYLWSSEKFQNKLMMMRELVNSFQDGADIRNIPI